MDQALAALWASVGIMKYLPPRAEAKAEKTSPAVPVSSPLMKAILSPAASSLPASRSRAWSQETGSRPEAVRRMGWRTREGL